MRGCKSDNGFVTWWSAVFWGSGVQSSSSAPRIAYAFNRNNWIGFLSLSHFLSCVKM